ncbi:MAG TPA: hypothetical protein VEC37_12205 [Bacillota bacterium]|nr:hypothetical protein [Bacillota bacterium]
MNFKQVELKRNKTRLILSNGSERSDFVPLNEIFIKLGRIHDGIQLLKTYYPTDPAWSNTQKISSVTAKEGVNYAWDYEYEDYHPFDVFEQESVTRKEIEAIKSYGSDLHLTLTLELSLPDSEIARIARALNPYGRIFLRINHEANGNWFRYSRQHTFQEYSDFFVRCHQIIKSNSSNIFTVFNLSSDSFVNEKLVVDRFLYLAEGQLRKALNIADYWSIDKYTSLHYGWPFEAEVTENSTAYFKGSVDDWWQLIEETYLKMIWHNNLVAKPLFINEFNSDSNVDGYEGQAEIIRRIYNRLAQGEFEWLAGITLYQFRDYGGLGLEKGNLQEYQPLPALTAYQQAIKDFKYELVVAQQEWQYSDYTFTWKDSDQIRGLRLDQFDDAKCFTNRFEFPLFVIVGKTQSWFRLAPNETSDLDGLEEFVVLIPPYKDSSGTMRDIVTIRDFKARISAMME